MFFDNNHLILQVTNKNFSNFLKHKTTKGVISYGWRLFYLCGLIKKYRSGKYNFFESVLEYRK